MSLVPNEHQSRPIPLLLHRGQLESLPAKEELFILLLTNQPLEPMFLGS